MWHIIYTINQTEVVWIKWMTWILDGYLKLHFDINHAQDWNLLYGTKSHIRRSIRITKTKPVYKYLLVFQISNKLHTKQIDNTYISKKNKNGSMIFTNLRLSRRLPPELHCKIFVKVFVIYSGNHRVPCL